MTVMDLKGFSLLKASNFFFLTITRVYGEVGPSFIIHI
jgi:hypothetical protein